MIGSLRCRPRRFHTWALIILVIIMVLIVLSHNYNTTKPINVENQIFNHPKSLHRDESKEGHSMCILVPFRDRFEELTEFVPRITEFLKRQNIRHKIVVINQVC